MITIQQTLLCHGDLLASFTTLMKNSFFALSPSEKYNVFYCVRTTQERKHRRSALARTPGMWVHVVELYRTALIGIITPIRQVQRHSVVESLIIFFHAHTYEEGNSLRIHECQELTCYWLYSTCCRRGTR